METTPFGRRLRELREAAGLTQMELAEKVKAAGVSYGAVRDIEQGKSKSPTWDTVLALAAALGVDCAAFNAAGDDEKAEDATPRKPGRPSGKPADAERAKPAKKATRKPKKGKDAAE